MIMMMVMLMVTDGDEEHNIRYFLFLITKEFYSYNGH